MSAAKPYTVIAIVERWQHDEDGDVVDYHVVEDCIILAQFATQAEARDWARSKQETE